MASRQLAESAGWEEDPSYGGLFIITAILVGVVCRTVLAGVRHRFNLPYTVLVLLMGVVYAFVAHNFNLLAMSHSMNLWVNINPHHLLYLLFPALIFGFAFNISFHTFVREAPAILMLAVPGVLLATLFTGMRQEGVAPLPRSAHAWGRGRGRVCCGAQVAHYVAMIVCACGGMLAR